MLEKRIAQLERSAPPQREPGPSAAAIMLNRVAILKGRSDLTNEEQSELDELWETLTEASQRC